MKRKKERGLEFGWGQINESDIKLLFAAVMGLAASQLPDARDLDASDVISSHGQGFGLTSLQRKAVEARAMKLAIEHYRKSWEHVKDVSASRCYDLECRCGRKTHRVEVKGTTGDGRSVLLMKNEVEHARQYFPNVSLFVVSGIRFDQKTGAAAGGKIRMLDPWDIKGCILVPLRYQCFLSE